MKRNLATYLIMAVFDEINLTAENKMRLKIQKKLHHRPPRLIAKVSNCSLQNKLIARVQL